MSDIEIEIDGRKLQAKPNQMVIQVADEAGIYIPRFCYHKHLSVAANCRMCLVEVEKSPKTLPACATPVAPGMKIFTRSSKALQSQRAVMEFLLINHPLDCPICDQGGECELQDLSLGYGSPDSKFEEGKRSVKNEDIGSLISTEMTRCIQCTRCVRFGAEIAGFQELGAVFRGELMEISSYVRHALKSEVSGNIIDLCPVGALTSKPYRFTARPWELTQKHSISPHDCIGTNINVHTRDGHVMRVVPRENLTINQTWISDRDRFSYEGLYHDDRLTKPRIRTQEGWKEVEWHVALPFAAEGLKKIIADTRPDKIGALASPNSTLEEFYLLQKMLRKLGSNNIDHRLRQVDFDYQEQVDCLGMQGDLNELEEQEVIFLLGSNIQKEQPIAYLRIRNAIRKGATVISLNTWDMPTYFNLKQKISVAPGDFTFALAQITKAIISSHSKNIIPELNNIKIDADEENFAAYLTAGKKISILIGAEALNHPEFTHIASLAHLIADETQARIHYLTEGANSVGAWIAGAVPHKKIESSTTHSGYNTKQMFDESLSAYILLNVEPNLDCGNTKLAVDAIEKADFVISLSTFSNPILEKHADVILPISPFTETSGTFVNAFGHWQSFHGSALPYGESRPGWKVLRVLANMMGLENFDYTSSEEVRDEVKNGFQELSFAKKIKSDFKKLRQSKIDQVTRIGEIPLYAVDGLVRRSKPLQVIQPAIMGELNVIRVHPETAKNLNIADKEMVLVRQQDAEVKLPVQLDERIPLHAAWVAGGIESTQHLGPLYGSLEIIKV